MMLVVVMDIVFLLLMVLLLMVETVVVGGSGGKFKFRSLQDKSSKNLLQFLIMGNSMSKVREKWIFF